MHYSKFGAEARKIMLMRDIKMIDLAAELGISVAYLSDIFRGARVGKKQRPLIAKKLGIEIETVK
jgi:transcriptional regulator with XRE-family HTH domain